jgi:membrane-associated phospholipid phosphatase
MRARMTTAAAFVVCMGAAHARKTLRLPRGVAAAALALAPMALRRALPPSRAASYATFLAQMWSYLVAFELPHDDPGAERARLRIRYVIDADRLLGRGVVPGARLQTLRAARPPLGTVLDRTLGAAYFAWAPERHAALLWVLWRHPARFARSAALVAAVFDLTLIVHTALPTAPPWYSAKYGHLQDPLERVTVEASEKLPLVPEQSADEADEANPWASMPSSHTASAVMVALVLAEADTAAGALGAAYAALLAGALVYLGEHYVIDVIAGVGVAVGIYAGEPLARPLAARAARLVTGG